MKSGKSRLSKVSDTRHSDVVEKMKRQGWRVYKTQNGHLRLEHDRAMRPVFVSSTPSCSYAHKKVEGDCRRALRGLELQEKPEPLAETAQPPAPETNQATKRKGRWSEAERKRREDAENAKIETSEGTETVFEDAVDVEAQPPSIEPEPLAPAAAFPALMMTVGSHDVHTPAPLQADIEAEATEDDQPKQALDLNLLEVAIRMLKGTIGSMIVTEDMVGKTLAWGEGKVFISDAMPGQKPSLTMRKIV